MFSAKTDIALEGATIAGALRCAEEATASLDDPKRCASALERAWDLATAAGYLGASDDDVMAARIDIVGTTLWVWTPAAIAHGKRIVDEAERADWFRSTRELITQSLLFFERQVLAGRVPGEPDLDKRHVGYWIDVLTAIDRELGEAVTSCSDP
jgi:hypothetical protein